MTPSRPYLLRAFYEWIVDNQWTPYIVINAHYANVIVPEQYVEDGRIILDISPHAVRELVLANSHIEFDARFAGVPFQVFAPIRGVSAIYAKENGRGMVFKEDEEGQEEPPPPPPGQGRATSSKGDKSGGKGGKSGGRPHLTLVKG